MFLWQTTVGNTSGTKFPNLMIFRPTGNAVFSVKILSVFLSFPLNNRFHLNFMIVIQIMWFLILANFSIPFQFTCNKVENYNWLKLQNLARFYNVNLVCISLIKESSQSVTSITIRCEVEKRWNRKYDAIETWLVKWGSLRMENFYELVTLFSFLNESFNI